MINIHKDEKLKIENRYAQRHRTEQKFACTWKICLRNNWTTMCLYMINMYKDVVSDVCKGIFHYQ